jgi:hypothetical protein
MDSELPVPREISSGFETSAELRPIARRRGDIIRAVVGLGKPIELLRGPEEHRQPGSGRVTLRPVVPLSLGQQSRGEQTPSSPDRRFLWESGMISASFSKDYLTGNEPRQQRTSPTRGI